MERKNASLKYAVEQLRAEIAKLKKASKRETVQPTQAPAAETPMEIPVAEPIVNGLPKKRALAVPASEKSASVRKLEKTIDKTVESLKKV